MEELMDLIASEGSPSEISDKLKDMLYTKSVEKVEAIRPETYDSAFTKQESEVEEEDS
tara:strand:+ start:27379 stop:27552 length:174 start_codon:yes stop_codon:yes gene_type:complete